MHTEVQILDGVVLALNSEHKAIGFHRPLKNAFVDVQPEVVAVWHMGYLTIKTKDEERSFEYQMWHPLDSSEMLKSYMKKIIEDDYFGRPQRMFGF